MNNDLSTKAIVGLTHSWPTQSYMPKEDFIEIVENLDLYEAYELERSNGDIIFFYTKLKMHAEYFDV